MTRLRMTDTPTTRTQRDVRRANTTPLKTSLFTDSDDKEEVENETINKGGACANNSNNNEDASPGAS
jgi:hypothetical protein